ncbi:MAG TPA: CHASE3 domain-containing protein, partial [Gammaproteobacteria bacterium]
MAPGKVPIRFRLLLGFAVPLAIWILVSGANIAVWNRAFENSERLFNSQSAAVLANEYISASLRAQAAKRGFLISSDPDFLALFRDAADNVNAIHRQLAERIRDDPDQFARLQIAGDRFQQWLYDVSWPHIEARRRLPVDAVREAHELEKAMLVLQGRHMRATRAEMRGLLHNVRDDIHKLMQREQLREYQ